MEREPIDKVFHALASPIRRRIIDIVVAKPGCNISAACRPFDVSRIAVMKHITVLEDAGLLVTEKRGRDRRLYFNAVPVQQIYERWTDAYSALWAGKVTAFKNQVERAS